MVDCKWIFEILIISYTRQAARHMSLNQPFGRDHGVMDPIRTDMRTDGVHRLHSRLTRRMSRFEWKVGRGWRTGRGRKGGSERAWVV